MALGHFSFDESTNISLSTPAKRSLIRSAQIKLNQILFRHYTNAPYISGDSIASLADYYVYGKTGTEPLILKKLLHSRSVFLNSDKLDNFFAELKNIEISDLILITGNSDLNFIDFVPLPCKIKLWICQNNGMPFAPNIITLPLGIENIRLGRLGLKKWYKRRGNEKKSTKILVPPMSPTNEGRFLAVEFTKKNPELFDVHTSYLHERSYFNLVKKYQFILCCEGNGFENHRTWEALYLGTFPVMLRTRWSISLQYLNLPILLVDSLEDLTEETVSQFAKDNRDFNPDYCDQLWIPFWKKVIQG